LGHSPGKGLSQQVHVAVLKEKIRREWVALDSDIVTNAISQWRRRLRACVHAAGGHFEHQRQ